MFKSVSVSLACLLLVASYDRLVLSDLPVAAQTFVAEQEGDPQSDQKKTAYVDRLVGKELLSVLRDGGTVIYIRHATTERDYADQADPQLDLQDCGSQRKLSLQGIKEAQQIGLAFAKKGIAVGKVITSEYCRAWQTANLAFGRHDRKDSRLNFLKSASWALR